MKNTLLTNDNITSYEVLSRAIKDGLANWTKGLCFSVMLVWGVWMIANYFTGGFDKDSTDNPNGARSGMVVHIDYKSGCHYLSTASGALVPRLDKYGDHDCSGVER